jgi:hypothetical protein
MRFIIILLFLTSCSSVEFDTKYFIENYTLKELKFFGQVGFYNGKAVKKWGKNIEISMVGEPKQGDIELIDSIINEIRPLIAPIKIERMDHNGNLKIKFVEKVDAGYANQQVRLGLFDEFQYLDINLPNNLKGTLRQATFRHEFLHALGLHHPQERNTGTLIESLVEFVEFDESNVKNYKYSELDKRMVKLLYESKIAKGLEKKNYLLYLDLKE